MNLFQKNIRLILVAFGIVAFVVFYLLAIKLFKNNKIYYVVLDKSIGLTSEDFVYVDGEKIGKIYKMDTLKNETDQLVAKLVLIRTINIPDKSYFQMKETNDNQVNHLVLNLIASSDYFNKNDTIPFLKVGEPKIASKEQLQPIETEIKEPEIKVPETEKSDIKVPETEKSEIKVPEKKVAEKKVSEKKVSENKLKTNNAKELSVSFKVQFAVSPNEIPLDSKKFKGIKNVNHYVDKGLFKYVTGNTKVLSESVKYCEEIKKLGFQDAFVVAFKGNERIPVKEAVQLLKK